MTPHAPEGTAFEENGGPNTGPVMDGEFLYVKYCSCHPATAPRHGIRPVFANELNASGFILLERNIHRKLWSIFCDTHSGHRFYSVQSADSIL